MKKVVLASASPRRITLLRNLGLDFITAPADIDESISHTESTVDAVKRIALLKARTVGRSCSNSVVIAADTVVVCKGQVLGKPVDEKDASAKLRLLSGAEHQVLTGICVLNTATDEAEVDHELTRVFFREIDSEEIENYISSGEPMDKAGAYGIQGLAGVFVTGIEGCYFNVVGLPLSRLYLMLKRQGVYLLGSGVNERIQNRHQGPARDHETAGKTDGAGRGRSQ